MGSCCRIAGLFVVIAVTLAGGCAVKQPPPPADALASVLPPSAVVPDTWKEAAGAPGPIHVEWVSTFGDPQLEILVNEALQNNLDLQAAMARVEVAIGIVTQARSLLFPQLSIVGGAGVVGRDGIRDRSGLAGDVSWELDVWGRVRAQAASAEAAEQAADWDLVFARQSLAAVVATLWYQTIATERLRRTAEEAATVYDDLLRLVRTQHRVGKVAQSDVALAGADLDRARHRERVYATSEQEVVRGLEVVIGRYPSAELALAADLPMLPAPVPAGLPSELLERRPDLIAAERRVAAAFHAIQVAKAARLPRMALTAFGGQSTSELLRLANVGSTFWSVGANLLAPIFAGGALAAQVEIATAEQRAALALYGQTALRAFSEVESTLASEGLLADQQAYLERVLTQDADAVRFTRIRYKVGASDLLDVLQLESRQLDTQFELIGVRADRLTNRVALHLALGGGFAPSSAP
jgi:NodT family efflux transporter outer membrane factor (OMF) lipoprotein